ncbi:MAG TPA: pentapeptide repeat-containing protein, partial [Candidatus Sulfotelmatobacter sp.]|nr:pentapeptide repeat-containing protein [Candidatus Sulfotelmatobacter sp.]
MALLGLAGSAILVHTRRSSRRGLSSRARSERDGARRRPIEAALHELRSLIESSTAERWPGFRQALAQLREPREEVRMWGTRLLGRIANQSEEAASAVRSELAVFIREASSSRPSPDLAGPLAALSSPRVPRDVQLAAAVLGRCGGGGEVDLRGVDLRGVDLGGANLEGADLSSARLDGASFLGARLRGANLRAASLRGALLGRADLEGADLRDAELNNALLSASFVGADLRGAQLRGAF